MSGGSADCGANINGFQQNFSGSKSIEDITKEMIDKHGDVMVNTLKALKLQACKTTQTGGAIGGCAVEILGCIGAGFARATSIGCETISVQASLSLCINKALQCVVTNIKTSSSTETDTTQNITVRLSSKNIKSTKIVIAPTQTTTVNMINFQNDKVKTQISTAIKSIIKDFQKNSSSLTTGSFSTPESQISVQDSVKAITNYASDTTVSNIVQETISKLISNQTITLDLEASESIDNDILKVNPEITNNYVIQNIQNNILDSIFKTVIDNLQESQQEDDQKQKNQGLLDGIFSGFLSLIVAIIVIMIIIRVIKSQGGSGAAGGCGSTFLLKTCGFLSAILLIFGVGMLIWGYIIKRSSSKTIGVIFISLGFLLIIISIALTIFYNKKCGTQNKQIKMQKIQQKS